MAGHCPRGISDCDCGAEYCEKRKPKVGALDHPPAVGHTGETRQRAVRELAKAKQERDSARWEADVFMASDKRHMERLEQAERELAKAKQERDKLIATIKTICAEWNCDLAELGNKLRAEQKRANEAERKCDRFAAVIAWQDGLLGYEPSHKVFEGWEREAIARHRAAQGGK